MNRCSPLLNVCVREADIECCTLGRDDLRVESVMSCSIVMFPRPPWDPKRGFVCEDYRKSTEMNHQCSHVGIVSSAQNVAATGYGS